MANLFAGTNFGLITLPGEFALKAQEAAQSLGRNVTAGMAAGANIAQARTQAQQQQFEQGQMETMRTAMVDVLKNLKTAPDSKAKLGVLQSPQSAYLWTTGPGRDFMSGLGTMILREHQINTDIEKTRVAMGTAEWERSLQGVGVPAENIKAGPTDPIYSEGATIIRRRKAESLATSADVPFDKIKWDRLPKLANGDLDEQAFYTEVIQRSPMEIGSVTMPTRTATGKGQITLRQPDISRSTTQMRNLEAYRLLQTEADTLLQQGDIGGYNRKVAEMRIIGGANLSHLTAEQQTLFREQLRRILRDELADEAEIESRTSRLMQDWQIPAPGSPANVSGGAPIQFDPNDPLGLKLRQ